MKKLQKTGAAAVIIGLLGACNHAHTAKENGNAGTGHHMHDMPAAPPGYADSVNAGLLAQDTMKSSPRRTAMATIGQTHLHITYHSPGVKGRVTWGGLVPYNTVWVTGAHTATSIQISDPVEIGGKKIEPGTYAIFTIPGEREWIFILNKNYQQHLTDDYKEAEDVLRVAVQPQENKMMQRLTYAVSKTGDSSGTISIEWDKIKILVPLRAL